MATIISKQIEDAQAQLHIEMRAALSKFSDTTGLGVRYVNWQLVRALDCAGNTASMQYYDMRSCLESSMS